MFTIARHLVTHLLLLLFINYLYAFVRTVCTTCKGIRAELVGGTLQLTQDFPIPDNAKFSSICQSLAIIAESNYASNSTLHLVVRVEMEAKSGTNRNVVPTCLFDFHIYPLATICNTANDRLECSEEV